MPGPICKLILCARKLMAAAGTLSKTAISRKLAQDGKEQKMVARLEEMTAEIESWLP